MGKLEVDKFAKNLSILKLCCFYYMFDPNSAKFLNRNVYRLLCIVFIAVNLCVLLWGHVGMFINNDDTLSDFDLLQLIIKYIYIYLNLFKIIVIVFKANKVWDLFDVIRSHFLTSNMCRKNINMLYDGRNLIIKIIKCYTFVILMICIQWILIPLVMNAFDDTVNRRKLNILNIPFPVSINTYNQYYAIFYVIELIVAVFIDYVNIIINTLTIFFSCIICIWYQIMTKSFADVGYANKPLSEHYEDFKSTLFDQIPLHSKLKLFYDVTWQIILIHIGLSSSIIILLTYVFIMVCSSLGSYTAFEVLKFGTSTIMLYIDIFLFCYLMNHINTNKDSVIFGMYSSNWTMMDLKFKKLLILAMRMNDANQIVLKASPKNIINLQLFTNVIKICFNIISVMLKTMNNKQKSEYI